MPTGIYTRKYTSDEEVFWGFVVKTDGCWGWSGRHINNHRGATYGAFTYQGKQILAHRFSYELHVGDIPVGMIVMHSCDIPDCTNPAHLVVGLQLDNHRDKGHKGRCVNGWINHRSSMVEKLQSLHRKGGMARIPDDKRARVIRLFVDSGLPQVQIAKRMEISQSMVSNILHDANIRVPAMWKNMSAPERVAMIHSYNRKEQS